MGFGKAVRFLRTLGPHGLMSLDIILHYRKEHRARLKVARYCSLL